MEKLNWEWAISGITDSMPRITGPDCGNFLTTKRRIFEGIIVTGLCISALKWSIKRLEPIVMPSPNKLLYVPIPIGKQILLILMTFIFGIEIGFKFSTKTMIYIFNPCHITTIIQIYLLASKPNKISIVLFRIQMNYLNGPFLACLFPEVSTRQLPFEQATYWIQHGLMFIIPIYLLRLKNSAYTMENIMDFNWNIIAYSIMMIYHFTFLQFLSAVTVINLNFMLCPAITDPFDGQNYRVAAFIHQGLLCPILSKLFTIIFSNAKQIQLDVRIITSNINDNVNETIYSSGVSNFDEYDIHDTHHHQQHQQQQQQHLHHRHLLSSSSSSAASIGTAISGSNVLLPSSSLSLTGTSGLTSTSIMSIPPQQPVTISRIEDPIMTTKID